MYVGSLGKPEEGFVSSGAAVTGYTIHVCCVCEGGVHVSVSGCGAQESVSDLLGLGLEVL